MQPSVQRYFSQFVIIPEASLDLRKDHSWGHRIYVEEQPHSSVGWNEEGQGCGDEIVILPLLSFICRRGRKSDFISLSFFQSPPTWSLHPRNYLSGSLSCEQREIARNVHLQCTGRLDTWCWDPQTCFFLPQTLCYFCNI